MSRRRRHRTSRQCSPESSQIGTSAASTKAPEVIAGSSPGQAVRDAPQQAGTLPPSPEGGLRRTGRFARPTTSLEPQNEGAVLIRIAQSDADSAAIHAFMIGHAAAEMAEAEVDALIYWRTIHDTVREGAGLIAMIGEEIAGYLGLWKSRYDYSKAFFLHDRGFYVLPAHRGGAVDAALLREARTIA